MIRNIKGHSKNKMPKIVVISTEYECQFCKHRYTEHRYGIVWLGRLLFKIPVLRAEAEMIENGNK